MRAIERYFKRKSLSRRLDRQLMEAVSCGETARVIELLAEGASPDACDSDGYHAVQLACMQSREEMFGILADAGANLHVRNRAGNNLLCTAGWSPAVTSRLISAGVDPRAVNHNGEGTVNVCLFYADAHPDALEMLVQSGADMTRMNDINDTFVPAVHVCAQSGNTALLSRMQSLGANLRDTDLEGRSILHAVCWRFVGTPAEFEAMAAYLISSGIPVDVCDRRGSTPLHEAVEECAIERVRTLMRLGANPKQRNDAGVTPMDLARNAHARGAGAEVCAFMHAWQARDALSQDALQAA